MPTVTTPVVSVSWSDVRGALTMFGLGFALIPIGLVTTWTDAPWKVAPWWHLLPLTALCVLMALRRKLPLAALGLGLVIFVTESLCGGSLASMLVFIEIVHAAGRYGRGPVADRLAHVIVGTIMAVAVITLIVLRDLGAAIMAALTVFAVLGTSYWWGESAKQQADLVEVERQRSNDLARLAILRAEEARRSEREAMARELHDALSGSLGAISIHAEAGICHPNIAPQALHVVRTTSKQAMEELQGLLAVLRPTGPAVRSSGIEEAVRAAQARGMEIWTRYDPDPLPALSPLLAHTSYRIMQEALTNAERHCPHHCATVVVKHTHKLMITVDSPCAANLSDNKVGYGMTSMTERVRLLGGHLAAGPYAGGWRVEAVLPLETPVGDLHD